MKTFKYDTILAAEDICNLDAERDKISRAIAKGHKVVVYGPRNFGKTSLILSVIIPGFERRHKKAFVVFVDLMQVKDLNSINSRIRIGFEQAFRKTFPGKNLLQGVTRYVKNLRPAITVDALTGEPSLTLKPDRSDEASFSVIFDAIRDDIAKDLPTLIVLDEFQDIHAVDEAEGLLRASLQRLGDIPVVVMGSKRHLLIEMFAAKDAPFADFGHDVEFHEIDYAEYHAYIRERFAPAGLSIAMEDSRYLQDVMNRIPEAVNIVGAKIVERFSNTTITKEQINTALLETLEDRRSRYEQQLAPLSINEQDILVAIAKHGPIEEPSSTKFLKHVQSSHATVLKIVRQLVDFGYLEGSQAGYRVSSPLLALYLKRYR